MCLHKQENISYGRQMNFAQQRIRQKYKRIHPSGDIPKRFLFRAHYTEHDLLKIFYFLRSPLFACRV